MDRNRRVSIPRFGRGFRDYRSFRNRNFEKPVNVGETYDVEIKEIGSKGDGIARVKNFVIFVPNTKQGEKCNIKITQVSRKFAIAEKEGIAREVPEKKPVEKEIEKEEEVAKDKKKRKSEVEEEEVETEEFEEEDYMEDVGLDTEEEKEG